MRRPKPVLVVLVAVPATAALVWAWNRWGERPAADAPVPRAPDPAPTAPPASDGR